MSDDSLRRLLHDVRDPLTALLARLELLRRRLPEAEPDVVAMIGDIRDAVAILDAVEPPEPGTAGKGPAAPAIWDDRVHAPLRGVRRVLQVDDGEGVSPLRALLVGRAGGDVDHASTAAEALAVLGHVAVDLAVVDWWLGGETADAVLAELARRRVPTVVLSGDPDAEAPARAHGAAFVGKPAPLRTILDALAAAVDPKFSEHTGA